MNLKNFFKKREYELEHLREQLNEFQQDSDKKLYRTIEQFNDLEKKILISRI